MPRRKKRTSPTSGKIFKKKYKGKIYEMKVVARDKGVAFSVGGKIYKTPTGAAKSITKIDVNGLVFLENGVNGCVGIGYSYPQGHYMKPKDGSSYSEQELIEQPTIETLKELGWKDINALQETLGPSGTLGRENQSEVILRSRLLPSLQNLNPGLPAEAFNLAIEELTRDRSRLSMPAANREIYQLLRNGVKVHIPDPEEAKRR